jgi:maleate isomerase
MSAPRSPSTRQRLGLIVPSSNSVAEVDFVRETPSSVTVHVARAYLAETTRAGEEAMLESYLPQAVRDVASFYPDLVVFSCTSAAALLGTEGEDELVASMADVTRAPVVSTTAAVSEVLRGHGAARVAVMTANTEELNEPIEKSLRDRGVDVVGIAGLDITDNFAIALVEPDELVAETRARLDGLDFDVLFVSCTNLRAVEALPALEREFGVPVVTSNSAALTIARERLARGTPERAEPGDGGSTMSAPAADGPAG